MKKFVKGLVKNLSLLAFTIGMIGGFVAYDELKEQRDANEEVIQVDIENASSSGLVGKYVDIRGGLAEVRETYEYGIGDLGDGQEMLASEFYYPIVLTEGGLPLLIVVADTPPALGGDNPPSRMGIVKSYRDMPEKIADAYADVYPDTSFVLLDTQYRPSPISEKYTNLIGFILLIIASLFAYGYSVRENPRSEDGAEQPLSPDV